MRYKVGSIGIQIHVSHPNWTHKAYRTINRQLDGFQIQNDFDNSLLYRLNFYDYATLPINRDDADFVVPRYC